jgi:hypothetical protein
MESAGICFGHVEFFTVIWYILWPFGNVVVIWNIFPRFGLFCKEKSGNRAHSGNLITDSDCNRSNYVILIRQIKNKHFDPSEHVLLQSESSDRH